MVTGPLESLGDVASHLLPTGGSTTLCCRLSALCLATLHYVIGKLRHKSRSDPINQQKHPLFPATSLLENPRPTLRPPDLTRLEVGWESQSPKWRTHGDDLAIPAPPPPPPLQPHKSFFVSLTDSKTEAVGGDGWSDPQIPRHGGEPLSTSSPAPAASVAPCRHGVAASAC